MIVTFALTLLSRSILVVLGLTQHSTIWVRWVSQFDRKIWPKSDVPYTIVVDGSGKVSEFKLGDHSQGQTLTKSVQIVSNEVVNGRRSISLTRKLKVKYNWVYKNWFKIDIYFFLIWIFTLANLSNFFFHF